MSFLDTETRAMLNASVDKFIQSEYPFERRQALAESDQGYSRTHWQRFAELGWLGVPFGGEFGGLGGHISDTLGIMRRFGGALVLEPYLSTVGLAGQAIAEGDNERLKRELLPDLVAGKTLVALASEETQARGNPFYVDLRAEVNGGQVRLHGQKITVLNGPQAQHLVVSARRAGEVGDAEGIDLFLVPADADELTRTEYRTLDGHRAANLHFAGVAVAEEQRLTPPGQAGALLQRVLDQARLMLAAEALGIMEVLLEKTTTYLRTRRQFGVALAEFQVLQHRLVDMYIVFKSAENLFELTVEQALGLPSDRARAVALLKVQIGISGRYLGQQAIQLHGGIGMTDELDVGHYFKRLTALELLLGGSDYHLKRAWQYIP